MDIDTNHSDSQYQHKGRIGICLGQLWTAAGAGQGRQIKVNFKEFMSGTATTLAVHRHSALGTILRGGTLCAVLDIAAAFLVYGGFFGVHPVLILQGIASGLLGPSAFDGGYAVALFGLLLHFFIAFAATAVYVLLRPWVGPLVQYAYISGALYGVAVYFFMAYVVVPLSAHGKGTFSLKGMIIGVVIHIFCVGLPIAVIARKYYLKT